MKRPFDVEVIDRGHGTQVELWWRGEMTHFATIHAKPSHATVRAAVKALQSAISKVKAQQRAGVEVEG